MKIQTLSDVLMHEIRDISSAEEQILQALPKMTTHATHQKLKDAFQEHLEQTKEHAKRIQEVASILDISLDGAMCIGMKGLIEEGAEILKQDKNEAVDAALISAAQRVEHYEIAAYGCAITYADLLGYCNVVDILKETIAEEVAADEKLTTIAEESINENAME